LKAKINKILGEGNKVVIGNLKHLFSIEQQQKKNNGNFEIMSSQPYLNRSTP
jgi:hypothetical protein